MFGSEHVVIGEEVVEAEVFDRPANTRPTAFIATNLLRDRTDLMGYGWHERNAASARHPDRRLRPRVSRQDRAEWRSHTHPRVLVRRKGRPDRTSLGQVIWV